VASWALLARKVSPDAAVIGGPAVTGLPGRNGDPDGGIGRHNGGGSPPDDPRLAAYEETRRHGCKHPGGSRWRRARV